MKKKFLLLLLSFTVYSQGTAVAFATGCTGLENHTQDWNTVFGSDWDIRNFFRNLSRKYNMERGIFLSRESRDIFNHRERDETADIMIELKVVDETPEDIGISGALGKFDLELTFQNRREAKTNPILLKRDKESAEEIYRGTISIPGIAFIPGIAPSTLNIIAEPFKEYVLGGRNGFAADGKPVCHNKIHRGFRLRVH